MAPKVTSSVRSKIGQWEALVLYAYDDFDMSSPRKFIEPGMQVRGTLTIGHGHTGTVKPGMRINCSRRIWHGRNARSSVW